ncbi:hypothetical protein LOTGIDRAFT_117302 [Lottia gigantea]|uniref:UDP-glucuronosyltransferase n=1 Tax=Lottia gigantea TaxID=225164 RepID=V4C102_LOTGI|nr:hypothetical protein LOTGIDRAFT_117302 [Lottia gigantea]ESO95139.1 hypothetical protein LOTGIDRAFT_117302 [Lottia gigantea]
MFFRNDRNLFQFFLLARAISFNIFTATFHSIKKIEERLRGEHFDIAIVDGIPLCQYYFYVAKFLSIPTIAEGSVIEQYLSNTPFQTNILPSPLSGSTNQMSFSGRLFNFFAQCFSRFLLSYVLHQPDVSILSPELNKYSAEHLYKESLLFIENADHIVDYPKAIFPNYIQAGPLTASPPKPLTPDLEKFMHKSVKEVVYISLGSVVESLPEYIIKKLETVAKDLEKLIIFKSNSESENGHIKHVKWVPQNDILGHNKTVLFLSHCGKNSFLESLYHGVPIICMPFNVDAFGIASKAEHFKIGAQFDIRTSTVEEISAIVNSVLNNRNIRENVQRASTIIKDRHFTPAQTACNAIEHVFKYGSDHMTSPMKDLSFLAYSGGDVWMVVFVASSFVCWLTTKLFLKCVKIY